MTSETAVRIPTIDFSKQELNPGTEEWDLVKVQVQQALQQYGCFEAFYGKIPVELQRGIFDALEEVFNLPCEDKLRHTARKPFPGYIGKTPKAPLFERIFMDDTNIPEEVERITHQWWPEGNLHFRKNIQSFSEELCELDHMIRRMVLESLGLEKYLTEHMESTYYSLRAMKYEPPQTTQTIVGLPSHTDTTIVTILYQNRVNGLEVETKDGKWITVNPSPDSFTVMAGECFHAWTNGRLYSPYHRVMRTGYEERYSVAFCSTSKGGYIVKAPEELVDEGHPSLYKPFDYFEFVGFYTSTDGQKVQSPLRTYCGVKFNLPTME